MGEIALAGGSIRTRLMNRTVPNPGGGRRGRDCREIAGIKAAVRILETMKAELKTRYIWDVNAIDRVLQMSVKPAPGKSKEK